MGTKELMREEFTYLLTQSLARMNPFKNILCKIALKEASIVIHQTMERIINTQNNVSGLSNHMYALLFTKLGLVLFIILSQIKFKWDQELYKRKSKACLTSFK